MTPGTATRFGRSLLSLWPLDPEAIYLNHGTVGVVPKQVLEAQQRWRDRIERHPARFILRDLWNFTGSVGSEPILMRQAAAKVASFVGARPADLVFVDNTTAGVNAVMQSLPLQPGGEVLVTDQVYGGLLTPARHWTARAGASVRTVELPYPAFDPAVALERLEKAITSRTRLVIVEHIVAQTSLILPVREIVALCRRRNVPVLIDGAHVPGQLELDVSSLGADFYIANLHKWAMAPRSCAFMAVDPAWQQQLHPPVISWGYGTGFTQEFDWVGTRDATPWLAAPDGIEFLRQLDWPAWRTYTHDLAWSGAKMLTSRWGTPLEFSEAMIGSMATVMTPDSCGTTSADAMKLRDYLLFERNIEVQVHARADRVWIRYCAQAYTEMSDLERLADAVAAYR